MGNDFSKKISQYVDDEIVSAMSDLIAATSDKQVVKSADIIAKVFGSSKALFEKESSDFEKKLISSFQKNLTLLIQKTWVEKADAELKEQVLYKLSEYCSLISDGKWSEAYAEFLKIISDVVYLMFGAQTKSDDFAEYALRIAPEFGVFWLYIKNLPESCDWTDKKFRIVMLLGMYFLANY